MKKGGIMNSIILVSLAASSAALANLFFRVNSSDSKKEESVEQTVTSYLLVFYLLSFVSSFFLFPATLTTPINYWMLFVGGIAGLVNVMVMVLTAKALDKGPAGLTFAFQNSSSVFPGLLLFLIFGSAYGFHCSFIQVVGMVLVLLGLYLGTQGTNEKVKSFSWLKWAAAAFFMQMLALTLIQGRCILFSSEAIPITAADDVWFMPGQFGVSALALAVMYFQRGCTMKKSIIRNGSLAGIANCAATACLLLATKNALPQEKAILFPVFSVVTIVLCNLWANRLYQEKFNFLSTGVCAAGIFLSLTDL